jgi:hypothetical protein
MAGFTVLDDGRRCSPAVVAAAQAHGLPLAAVASRGPADRVTMADVLAAADAPLAAPATRTHQGTPQAYTLPRSAQAVRDRLVQQRSAFRPTATVTVDLFALNPLLEDLRQLDAQWAAAAERTATPPTLFDSGDLPPFTASGLDPTELLRVPYGARHALARAGREEALRLVEDAAHLGAEAAQTLYAGPEVHAYAERMRRWAVDGMPEDQLYAQQATRPAQLRAYEPNGGAR